jgi:putative inorganic carbon (HCO3(-)) transporter
MHRRRIGTQRWLNALEPATVALAAPFLLFPAFRPAWTAAALTVLLLVYLAGWLGTGRVMARTPLDLSLLVLMLTIPVAVWASALPEATLPKLTGLILGLAVYRTTVNGARTSRHLDVAVVCFLALGAAMSVVGLLGTQWSGKWPALAPLLSRIPRLVPALPGAEGGLQPNELAGVLLFFLPVSLVAIQGLGLGNGWQRWLLRIMALLLAFCFTALLVLTQSRSAWIGAVVGLAVMAGIRWRPAGWLLAGTALVVASGLYAADPESLVQALFPSADTAAAAGIVSLQGRFEIWSRAVYAIQDFPFTGTGLGTFRRVAPLLYPLFLIGSELDIGHAHNVFLR